MSRFREQQNIDMNSDDGRGKEKPEISEPKKQKKINEGGGGDASIEVVRRPRGRPPGSKNKPKQPVAVTPRDSSGVMRSHVFEIPAGHDVGDSISVFSRRRNLHLSVIAATGSVSNVTFRQTSLSLHGRFEILSVSGTFLPPSFTANLSVSLAGPMGEIVGGVVAGPLVAARTVMVVAAGFQNPSFCRIPMEEDVSVSVSGDCGRTSEDLEEDHQKQQQRKQEDMYQSNHNHQGVPTSIAETSIYSCHLPSDLIWAPIARTQHRSPY